MNYVFIVPAALLSGYFCGRLIFKYHFYSQLQILFSHRRQIHKKVELTNMDDLPPPVRRYFRHVLTDGMHYVSCARLKHTGIFKRNLEKNWVPVSGEQYFTVMSPGFIWKGTIGSFSAIDSYINGKGRLSIWLLSAFRIADTNGRRMDRAELLRWLGEDVWIPTNLLPSRYVTWEPLSDNSARLLFCYRGIHLDYTVFFNENNEICRMETMRSYNNGAARPWAGTFTDYRYHYGMKVPMQVSALWILEGKEYPYARFHLNFIEYNVARQIDPA